MIGGMPAPSDIRWSSDRTLLVTLGDRADDETVSRVARAHAAILAAAIAGVRDVTPAYATVQVRADPHDLSRDSSLAGRIAHEVEQAVTNAGAGADGAAPPPRTVEIPVCYDPRDFGPDLEAVARERGMSVEGVIGAHAGAAYRVCFLGFSPGFAYLRGLPASLHSPRLASPRARVPAGSVAIAGSQAGVYPSTTPGGWRVLGRTPLTMFHPARDGPSLLRAGDAVRFVRVDRAGFEALSRGAAG